MNPVYCHACTGEIVAEQAHFTCNGFCNAIFHVNCGGASAEELLAVKDHNQFFWMCRSCTGLMNNIRFRRTVQSAYQAGQENVLGDHDQVVQKLKNEIMNELRSELSSGFSKLINSKSYTPMSCNKQCLEASGRTANSNRRRLFGNKLPQKPTQAAASRPDPSMIATGADVSPSIGSIVAPNAIPKYWLYLSRIANTVTAKEVKALAVSRLGTTDIDVHSLVAKGRDPRYLNFISFRVGVREDLKEKALSLSTWPAGLLVREFVNQNNASENFWAPQVDPENAEPNAEGQKNAEDPNMETDTEATQTPTSALVTA